MAPSWNSVIGPRADDGERRHDWDSWPNARAHSEDSLSSSAPCWLIGLTTWDETVDGSTGTYCRVERSWTRRLSETSRSSAGRSSPSVAMPRVGLVQTAAHGGLFVERRRHGLEELALLRAELGHRSPRDPRTLASSHIPGVRRHGVRADVRRCVTVGQRPGVRPPGGP